MFVYGVFKLMTEPTAIKDGEWMGTGDKKVRGVSLFVTDSHTFKTAEGKDEWISYGYSVTRWCYTDAQFEFFKNLKKYDRLFIAGEIEYYNSKDGNEIKMKIKPTKIELIASNGEKKTAEPASTGIDLPV